jgi:predicted pyridoxine 5'-phosphate oxidase superfamily flavin-nucleotide-binding protein
MSYHEGELEMQRRAGMRDLAERVARIISPEIPAAAAAFLAAQPFLVVSNDDVASLISGPPGFAFASTPREVTIRTEFEAAGAIGILAIDLATRRRMRVNGDVMRRGDTLVVTTREVYSNCPQYIHPRRFDGRVTTTRTYVLDSSERDWIARADTFFLATSHPTRGADASHRGGEPGFVRVESPTRLSWPDYPGNNMFNSLGNLAVNPRCGLLFVDFDTHRALQLVGRAVVEGDAERVVRFVLE